MHGGRIRFNPPPLPLLRLVTRTAARLVSKIAASAPEGCELASPPVLGSGPRSDSRTITIGRIDLTIEMTKLLFRDTRLELFKAEAFRYMRFETTNPNACCVFY
jgi:hypothetical protein